MKTVSCRELVRRSPLSYRQADYWLRLGVLETVDGVACPGQGSVRQFREDEVRVASVCARLAELGCSTNIMRVAAGQLRAITDWASAGWLFVRSDGTLASMPEGSGWIIDLSEFDFERVAA